MTSHSSDRPVSVLRARMIEDMCVRGFTEKTRKDYIRNVRSFAAFISRSPDLPQLSTKNTHSAGSPGLDTVRATQ